MPEQPLSPAWTAALERVRRASSSPVLMPVALLALVDLFESGEVDYGEKVSLVAFDVAFRARMSHLDPQKSKDGWRPFFHLGGRAGVWTLWRSDKTADFTTAPGQKPKSAASLAAQVDHARIDATLLPDLKSEKSRRVLKDHLERLLG